MPRPKRPQQYYDQIKDKFREERNLRLGTARREQISTPRSSAAIWQSTRLTPMRKMFQKGVY